MEMEITFPGGARVDAHLGSFTVETDQPTQVGGEDLAAASFVTFLASIGTCAVIYVLEFFRQWGLSSEGVRLIQHIHANLLTGMAGQIDLEIRDPHEFPQKHTGVLVRTAELCVVREHLEHPPSFRITTNSVKTVVA